MNTETPRPGLAEPTTPGWYAYSGGRQTMIFCLRDSGQWSVHFDSGTAGDCSWAFIEQALGVWGLVRIDPTHLLARLTDDDVVEAGARGMVQRLLGEVDPRRSMHPCDLSAARAALSAAAALIGGGSDE